VSCNGATNGSASVTASGGTGSLSYSWSPSGGTAATASGLTAGNYTCTITDANTCSITQTFSITEPAVLGNNTVAGAGTICNGTTTSLTGSIPTGATGSYTYEWQSSISGPSTGFSAASGTNNAQDYTTSALSQTTWFRRVATSGPCGSDVSTAAQVTITNTNVWTGSTSTAWSDGGNWSCGLAPSSSSDVIINSGTPNALNISTAGSANSVTVNTGATLTISNTLVTGKIDVNTGATLVLNNINSVLDINDSFNLNGSFVHTNGKVEFSGTSEQQAPGAAYYKLVINNPLGVTLDGSSTVANDVEFQSGILALGNRDLTLTGSTSTITGADNTRFILTDGAGKLTIEDIGTTGRTGSVLYPVGHSTSSYTPFTLTNAGTLDDYSVRVTDSLRTDGLSGTSITTNGVNKTWVVEEAVAGGSDATLTAQWNGVDELSGFNRSVSYLAQYNGTTWMPNTSSAALGSNPYTQTRTGVSVITPVGIASNGTLPVNLISFTAALKNNTVKLDWKTASEVNNDRFIIERSSDNRSFAPIATVKGAGNSMLVSAYTTSDETALAFASANGTRTIYYRLTQVDFDGRRNIHNSIPVLLSASKHTIVATPNPFNSRFDIAIDVQAQELVTISITDLTGKQLASRSEMLNKGFTNMTINELQDAKAGIYFITVTTGNQTEVIKIVKE
jgi:hypothetical protein